MEFSKYLAETTTDANLILFFGVLGTWVIAALAIWGEPIRLWLIGPKLELKLHDTKGEITTSKKEGITTPIRYYHLDVINKRKTAKALNVRVQINKLLRPLADGSFTDETLSSPLQLMWQFPFTKAHYLTIGYNKEVCDLGFIPKGSYLKLTPYVIPNKYDIILRSLQKFKVEIVAIAENAESNKLNLEISWDGEWDDDSDKMSKHLVVKEIKI